MELASSAAGGFEGLGSNQRAAGNAAFQAAASAVPGMSAHTGRLMLSPRQVADLLGVSLRTVSQMRADGRLPEPRALGPRTFKWSRSDIEAAIEQLPRKERSPQPHELLRSRIERAKQTGDLGVAA